MSEFDRQSVGRRRLQRAAFIVGVVAATWAGALEIFGGFDLKVFGHLVTSNNPERLWIVAIGAFAIFFASGGSLRHVADWQPAQNARALQTRLGSRVAAGLGRVRRVVSPDRAALALAIATFVFGVAYATTVAGGSDSYGYISQADLWLKGDLHVEQPWAEAVPWPTRNWSFSPLGYHPSAKPGDRPSTLVPTYSPGLPLLMAGAKLIGGQEGMFWVVPIFGGLLVLATYGIGRRLQDPTAGLIGAWLVATSPAVLFMLVAPMTDVPVAGAFAVAFYFLLGQTSTSASLAGLFAGLAVIIRPNLFLPAGVMGLWFVIRMWTDGKRRRLRAFGHGAAFAAGLLPGIVFVAIFNTVMFGSPSESSYGSLQSFLDTANIWPNAQRYITWIVQTQTPIVLLGFLTIFVPLRRFWPGVRARSILVIFPLFMVALWAFYCVYLVFDVWWYLRFLLSAWPFIMLGVGAACTFAFRHVAPVVKALIVVALVGLGAYELKVSSQEFVFVLWQGDRHYPSVARAVRSLTDGKAVILSMQHSGSMRYYGGRVTLRYDQIDRDWLDRAVTWLAERQAHPYLLVAEWEIPAVKARFTGQHTLDIIDRGPIMIYTGPSRVMLYDLAPPAGQGIPDTKMVVETYEHLRSLPPVPMPRPSFARESSR